MQKTSNILQKRRIEKFSFMFRIMFFGQCQIYGDNFQRRKTQSGVEIRKIAKVYIRSVNFSEHLVL